MTTDTEAVAASDSRAGVVSCGRSTLRYGSVAAAPALLIVALVVHHRTNVLRQDEWEFRGIVDGWSSLYRSVTDGSRKR
jgi:hypothetical protein